MKKVEQKSEQSIIVQSPNLPIIVWFITLTLGIIVKNGVIAELIDLINFGAIFTWSWLEIFQGINIYRKTLGVFVMTLAIYNQF